MCPLPSCQSSHPRRLLAVPLTLPLAWRRRDPSRASRRPTHEAAHRAGAARLRRRQPQRPTRTRIRGMLLPSHLPRPSCSSPPAAPPTPPPPGAPPAALSCLLPPTRSWAQPVRTSPRPTSGWRWVARLQRRRGRARRGHLDRRARGRAHQRQRWAAEPSALRRGRQRPRAEAKSLCLHWPHRRCMAPAASLRRWWAMRRRRGGRQMGVALR